MANSPDTAKKRGQRERANAFWNALEPISDEFSKIENVQLSGKASCLNGPETPVSLRNHSLFKKTTGK
jgi:hypothetical protein